jgi:hypothetical protein
MRNTQITAIFLQYGGDIQASQYGVSSKIIRHFEWQTYFIKPTFNNRMRNTQITAIFLQYGGDIQALQYDVSLIKNNPPF